MPEEDFRSLFPSAIAPSKNEENTRVVDRCRGGPRVGKDSPPAHGRVQLDCAKLGGICAKIA
ncbi:hypothetical protein ABTE65_19350, partial [Acinetobacter baumannii]